MASKSDRSSEGRSRPTRRHFVLAASGSFLMSLVGSKADAAAPSELFGKSATTSSRALDHRAWDTLLKTYIKPSPDGLNKVNYAGFKKSGHADLKAYVMGLEAVDPSTLNRAEQFAFLANLYNAKTIDIVLDRYPVKSIKDISLGGGLAAAFSGGPWKAKVIKLGREDLSLDDIEHGILRQVFKDPRLHYAVNCASIGCPNLQIEAWTGGRLDAQLDAAARAYINHPRGVSVHAGDVRASSIYSWFAADFGGTDAGVLSHLRKYADTPLRQQLAKIDTISGYFYDWSLNDASS